MQESKTTKIYQQILDDLEEGIIIFENNLIDFKNDVFSEMVQRLKITRNSLIDEDIKKLKFLRIYRKEEAEREDE